MPEQYKAPTYDEPYHVNTYKHLMKEIKAGAWMNPEDRDYACLWTIASQYAPNIDAFINALATEINDRSRDIAQYSNNPERHVACDRVIALHTFWIARCKAISDDLTEEDEELEPLGVDFLPDLD